MCQMWVPEETAGSSCGHRVGQGPEQSLSQPESRSACQPSFPTLQWQPVPGPPAKDPPSPGMAPSRPPSHRAGCARAEGWHEACLASGVPQRAAPHVGSQAGRAYENSGRGSSSDFRVLVTLNRPPGEYVHICRGVWGTAKGSHAHPGL